MAFFIALYFSLKISGLTLRIDIINVKATTEEGLGFTGTGEGISSQAICAIEKYTNYRSVDMEAETAGCGGCCGIGAAVPAEAVLRQNAAAPAEKN